MPRYILIDSNSGFIWGDTADFAANRQREFTSIIDAARLLDESLGAPGRTYEVMSRNPGTTQTGYDVYRADIDGSEALPIVQDGQDEEAIAAVQDRCRYLGFVVCGADA